MRLARYQNPRLIWRGFGGLSSLQHELEKLFESPLADWAPALDVYEDKDNIVVHTELPGLKREDIDVSLQEGVLVISGERKTGEIRNEGEIRRQERFYGKFQRTLTLPAPVAADKVKAQYKDGVLTVTVPKAEEAKPKKIDVSVN